MESDPKHKATQEAIKRIRQRVQLQPVDYYVCGILAGDRRILAEALTLIESTLVAHQQLAYAIVSACLSNAGKSIRIGITGIPGVGKSTFIEAFGTYLIEEQKKKVAVLAIDPSSPVSKGSILGDKTRMEKLSALPQAFIRPSPAADSLGGVARKTRESIVLCEAAGFDCILIETVGVGQSEIAVRALTDFFLLLMLAGAGDQLQGIKRGIMEMCDGILITKADGDYASIARRARSDYFSALRLFSPKDSGWTPQIEICSALENTGIDKAWTIVQSHDKWMKERGFFTVRRRTQDLGWMHETIRQSVLENFFSDPKIKAEILRAEEWVSSGKITPFEAADHVLKKVFVSDSD